MNRSRVLSCEGMSRFCKALKKLVDLQQIHLNFVAYNSLMNFCWRDRCSEISDLSLEALGEALKEQNNLQKINFSFAICREISDIGMRSFCENLGEVTSLQSLALDFAEYFINIWLNSEYYRCKGITGKGLSCVGQALKSLKSLKTFDFIIHR